MSLRLVWDMFSSQKKNLVLVWKNAILNITNKTFAATWWQHTHVRTSAFPGVSATLWFLRGTYL